MLLVYISRQCCDTGPRVLRSHLKDYPQLVASYDSQGCREPSYSYLHPYWTRRKLQAELIITFKICLMQNSKDWKIRDLQIARLELCSCTVRDCSPIYGRNHCRWRSSMLSTHCFWARGNFIVPHLLWHGTSVTQSQSKDRPDWSDITTSQGRYWGPILNRILTRIVIY